MTQQVAEMSTSAWSGRGSLDNLVKELDRQKESKIDFVADTRGLQFLAGENPGTLKVIPIDATTKEWLPNDGCTVRPQVIGQIASKSTPEIPAQFLRRLIEQRPLRAQDLLNGLNSDEPQRRLIRCLDGHVRAWLSNSYRVIDNYDMAFAALDAVRDNGGEIIECSLSDTNMRLKFTSRSIWDVVNETRKGDRGSWYAGGLGNQAHLGRVAARTKDELPGGPGTIHPLVTISNSETGHGGLAVRVGVLRAICFNLATVEDVAVRVHLGERLEVGMFRPETVATANKAIMMQCVDAIKGAFNPQVFSRLADKCKAATERKIEAPQSAVQNLVSAGLADECRERVLQHFLRDYDQNQWGLSQAVARAAQDEPDPDVAFDMEALSGRVLAGAVAFA